MIPATWTDLHPATSKAADPSSRCLGSVGDLLHARTVVDALLRRLAESADIADMESHRATQTDLSRSPSSAVVPVGALRSRTKSDSD